MSKDERRKASVREFNKLLPTLNGFAASVRSVTGKRLRVQAAGATYTDGETIFIKPPLALASTKPHEKRYCDKRDHMLQQLCGRCATREFVMSCLYHELAHNAFGSFVKQTRGDLDHGLNVGMRSIQSTDPDFVQYAREKLRDFTIKGGNFSCVAAAGAVSPFLQAIIMGLEDFRIDSAAVEARQGIAVMSHAQREKVLIEGIETDEGFEHWRDRDANMQISCAMLMDLHGHDLEGRFSDQCLEALSDNTLQIEMAEMYGAQNVLDTWNVSVRVLVRLRQLGFMVDWGAEPEPKDENGEAAPHPEDENGEPMSGDNGEKAVEAMEQATGHDKMEAAEQSDQLTDKQAEELGKIIGFLDVFDQMSGTVGALKEYDKVGEGRGWDDSGYAAMRRKREGRVKDISTPESIVGRAVLMARRVFQDNAQARMERNRKSGRIRSNVLGKRAHLGDERLFQKKRVPGKRDYEVVIGLDISGSTAREGVLENIQTAAAALASVCHRSGVKFSVFAHSEGVTYDDDSYTTSVEIYRVKQVGDPWDEAHKAKLVALESTGGNLDGHTMQYYRKVLDRSRATDKILMYFTDGAMPASNYDEELAILKSEIETCRKQGITLLGVGIGTDSPIEHGLDTVQVDDASDIIKVVDHLTKVLVK